jgi:hypothetical protein
VNGKVKLYLPIAHLIAQKSEIAREGECIPFIYLFLKKMLLKPAWVYIYYLRLLPARGGKLRFSEDRKLNTRRNMEDLPNGESQARRIGTSLFSICRVSDITVQELWATINKIRQARAEQLGTPYEAPLVPSLTNFWGFLVQGDLVGEGGYGRVYDGEWIKIQLASGRKPPPVVIKETLNYRRLRRESSKIVKRVSRFSLCTIIIS